MGERDVLMEGGEVTLGSEQFDDVLDWSSGLKQEEWRRIQARINGVQEEEEEDVDFTFSSAYRDSGARRVGARPLHALNSLFFT